jgi:predicted amidohydrolase
VWPRLETLAARPGDPLLARIAAETCRLGLWALVGYPERRRDGIHNVVGLFGPGAPPGPTYSKVHLFGRERRHFTRGDRYLLLRLPGLTVGVLVCFDLEFPEPARALARAGAELIAVATANMEPFREAQDVYVRSRALENQVFVALANRVGREGRTRFVGGSGVWDPAGRPLATADREERMLLATVDRGRLARERRRFMYLQALRPETYTRRVVTLAAAPGRAATARPR